MKKTMITGIAILTSLISFGQIAEDKKKHFEVGAITSAVVNVHVYAFTGNNKKAFMYGIASSFAIGLAKEIKDEVQYKGFDSKDLLATVLGGITISIPLDRIVRKRRNKLTNKQ